MTWWLDEERPPSRVRFDPTAHAGALVTTRDPETNELVRCTRCGDIAEFDWARLPDFTHHTGGLRWCESCIPHAPAAGRTPEPAPLPRAA